ADILEFSLLIVAGLADAFCHDPGLGVVKGLVDGVSIRHGLSDCTAVFATLERLADCGSDVSLLPDNGVRVAQVVQLAIKVAADEVGRPTGNIDIFADEVAVDTGNEVVGVEVDVLDTRIELGGNVIAHPLGIHAQVQIAYGRDRKSTRLNS